MVYVIDLFLSFSSLRCIHVQFLDNSTCILDNLLIAVGSLLSKWLYDLADSHLFKSFATLLVHAKVSNREQGDASWRLGRTFIVGHYIKQLLECMVLDKIFAQSI